MMTKKAFILIVILCIALSAVNAQQRSFSAMKRIAQEKLASDDVNLLENRDGLCVYGNERGFVIVNRQGMGDAVIGYSHTPYDKNRLPDGLKWWMKVAESSLQSSDNTATSVTARAGYTVVEPFVTTTWNQEKPYYYECPKNGNDYCPTGCVATTLAQVLNYYQYPASSEGTGSYFFKGKEVEKTINTTYDWANMKNSYKTTELRFSAPVKAVTDLMRDCGYATHMTYTLEGSGTADYYMALALKNVFRYDSLALRYYDRSFYSDEEWKSLVYGALEQKMPVMFGGYDEEASYGHEFLLCGIDKDGLVYVNWGWGGDGDGYFDLDVLKINKDNDFRYSQSIVLGTKPQQTPDETDRFESMCVAGSIDYEVNDENMLQMKMYSLYNYSILDFNGTIDLALQDKSNPQNMAYVSLLNTRDRGYGSLPPFYGFIFTDENDELLPILVDGLKDLAPGIYRMFLTNKEERDSERQAVRTEGGVQYATLKKLADGTLLVSNEDVDDIETGIQTVRMSPEAEPDTKVYDLSGRQHRSAMRRNIYVIDGKKVLSK